MTPYLAPGYAPDGTPLLSVLAKQTYDLVPGQELVESQTPLPFRDGDGELESELIAYKPMTDVLLVGRIHAPRGKQARFMDAGVAIGNSIYAVRVFGNRRADLTGSGITFSEPELFESMPLDLSRAYGGTDTSSQPGTALPFPPNPHGRGFLLARSPQAPPFLELPNLEDLRQLLTPQTLLVGPYANWPKAPSPAAFGQYDRTTVPRIHFAGMPPSLASDAEVERRKRMQAMPEIGAGPKTQPPAAPPILNPQYYQSAAPRLQFPYLRGDETIVLQYFHPDFPRWQFQLPGDAPQAWIDTGIGAATMDMVLHTVEIHPDAGKLSLLWCASAYYGGPAAMQDFTRLDFGMVEDAVA